jgi:hypothetical protein
MMASTSTGAEAAPADALPLGAGTALGTGAASGMGPARVAGAALGAGAAPVPAGFVAPPFPTAALLASVILSHSFPKMLTRRLAELG